MNTRCLAILGLMAVAAPASAQTWTPPRAPDGHPDLQGFWTNATITPMERPRELGAKEFYTADEAAEVRKKTLVPAPTAQRGGTEAHYEFTQFGLDRTQAPVAFSLQFLARGRQRGGIISGLHWGSTSFLRLRRVPREAQARADGMPQSSGRVLRRPTHAL